MSSLSTPTPVGTCGTPSTPVDDTPADDTPSDAPGVLAAVIAPAKDQRGGHRGGKRTQACGATGKQKQAHNSICLNHCKYGDDVGVCCPDNGKFRETNWLVGNNGGGHCPFRPPRLSASAHRLTLSVSAVVSHGHHFSILHHPPQIRREGEGTMPNHTLKGRPFIKHSALR